MIQSQIPLRSLSRFPNPRAFLAFAEARGDLERIDAPLSLRHEMTAFQLAAQRRQGPILRFDAHDGPAIPVIGNLFGTRDRVAAGLGLKPDQIPALGDFLASRRSPMPPVG